MATARSISKVLYAGEFDMGGLTVRQAFPSPELRQVDPFVLLHHANVAIAPDTDLANAGVGPHPHRGFSPVTFIFSGGVHHRDSRGHDSTIYAGGTQWMHAGSGIVHSERPPHDIFERGGRQEIIQMWVNTPAKHKFDEPKYIPLTKEQTPHIKSPDALADIYLQSGSLFGKHGPIETMTPINAATIDAKAGAKLNIPLPRDHHAFVYILNGKLSFDDGTTTEGHHAVVFKTDGDSIAFEAAEASRLLLMSGKPIDEPLVMYGPFVMNTEGEIRQAFVEYQLGKMGELAE